MWGGVCWHDKAKTPDRSDLKLGTVVVLDSLSKPVDFGFKKSRVIISNFRHPPPSISVERMQLQNSNFEHKCTTGGYCLRIKNYAGMRRVSQNRIPVKSYPHLHNVPSNENVKWFFRDTSYNGWSAVCGYPLEPCLSCRRGFASPQIASIGHFCLTIR